MRFAILPRCERFANASAIASRQPVLRRVAAARRGEVERFERGDVVEIGGADFVQQRMLFDAEERQLPVAGSLGGVAVGDGGRDCWRLGSSDAGRRFGGLMLRLRASASTSRARSLTLRGTPASWATWMP